jgi:peptide/nickel transport system permease protein
MATEYPHGSSPTEAVMGPLPAADAVPPPGQAPVSRGLSIPRRLWAGTINLRSSRVGMIGFAMVSVWVVVALFAPLLERYNPNEQVVAPLPPGATFLDLPSGAFPSSAPYRADDPATPADETIQGYVAVNTGPTSAAWFGTDDRGRDVYSRLIAGTRQVMTIAPISILIGATIGILLGLIAGYKAGWIDEILMRILDAIIAFPAILIFLLVVSSLGASRYTVVSAIALAAVPGVARLARAMALDLRNREYVSAARLRGEGALYIMVREILPNARGPIVIDLTLRMAYAVFAIATLGFLGLGLPPPTPDWGTMVAEARNFVGQNPWAAVFPAAAIASLVVGLNLMADGIREEGTRYR